MEWHNREFWISDDINRLSTREVARLHQQVYGVTDAYSEKQVCRLFGTCCWLGLYKGEELIGFVRAITDKLTLCFICDFIIDSKFQRQGLGTWLMNCFLEHPDVSPTFIGLGTQAAGTFFEKFDFENVCSMRRTPRPESFSSEKVQA